MQYEVMECDVLIIGGGPAGLSAAIRLAQLARQHNKTLSIMLLEKGASIGAHILSGCVLDPKALDELLPDWQQSGAPVTTKVSSEAMRWLGKNRSIKLPTPQLMQNHGNYIISLGQLCIWLAGQAEALGVQIMPGFAVAKPWIEHGVLQGGITGEFGRDKNGEKTANYQPPIGIKAKYTLMAEGCRGSFSEEIIEAFDLRQHSQHQTYALGLKEIWQIDPAQHRLGHVEHLVGWPLDSKTYGGGFIYHAENSQAYLGLVASLDYQNPYFDPYLEFQKFKTHPHVKSLLTNGKRISYGAKALNEGGLQSVPTLTIPGGAIIGCSAGFLNVPKIKGTHTAMKSGMLAAEAVMDALNANRQNDELTAYSAALKQSWVWDELTAARNIRPSFKFGRLAGMLYSGLDMMLLKGSAPWTFSHPAPDHLRTRVAASSTPLSYPKPDGKITFDRNSSLFLSGTNHEENQPSHLILKNDDLAIDINWNIYQSPEQRYCPAGVYEITQKNGAAELLIHAQNCLHCKSCDIKDPTQNIKWQPPEGGGGPNYGQM